MYASAFSFIFFFFNDTATTEIYTLSLHDALPISAVSMSSRCFTLGITYLAPQFYLGSRLLNLPVRERSEEHTSELQSLTNLVCRLLLEKKNKIHCCPKRPHRELSVPVLTNTVVVD